MTQNEKKECVKKIGIILGKLPKVNYAALKYFILQLNKLQSIYEFQFIPADPENEFIKKLSDKSNVDREEIRSQIDNFTIDYKNYLEDQVEYYSLSKYYPDHYILVTTAIFKDNYYLTQKEQISIIALGNWENSMAPPSLIEFIQILVLRLTVAAFSPSVLNSIHLGTKSCLFDFTPFLADVKFKIFQGFICDDCKKVLLKSGIIKDINGFIRILNKEWIGDIEKPGSPANIMSSLGYNLFITKGLISTNWEKILNLIQQEGTKQILRILGTILIMILLAWLGFKN
jgi:hypothetical protein